MRCIGGGGVEGVKLVIKQQKHKKKKDGINLPPYFLVCDDAFILTGLLVAYLFFSDVICCVHAH